MSERKETIVQSCIDFRFGNEVRLVQQENQAHLMATAGASLNPQEVIDFLNNNHSTFQKFINLDHEDCGAYKNFAHDDSDLNHQRHIDALKEEVQKISGDIEFVPMILRLTPEFEGKHCCKAATIVLGDPDVLRVAFQRMEEEELIGKHDIIARPFDLTNHDSILNDLKISTSLHRPPKPADFRVFIFDEDEENAMILEKKVAQTIEDAKIEAILVSRASQEESVA